MNYAITLHILLDLCLKQELSILELGKKKLYLLSENNSNTSEFPFFRVHSYCFDGIFNQKQDKHIAYEN